MANVCSYEYRVKGARKAVELFWSTQVSFEADLDITYTHGTDADYEMHFTGDCKWSVNWETVDAWNGEAFRIDALDRKQTSAIARQMQNCSNRLKSELLHCEIMVHYWSQESGFDQFDHYKNGQAVKRRKIAYEDPAARKRNAPATDPAPAAKATNPLDLTFSVSGTDEKDRSDYIETIEDGDFLQLVRSTTVLGGVTHKGIEVFSFEGDSLGLITDVPAFIYEHLDKYSGSADHVAPLSLGNAVAALDVHIQALAKHREFLKQFGTAQPQPIASAACDPGSSFDWQKTEFIGHEGEYDDDVDSEESDADFLQLLRMGADMLGGRAVDTDDDDAPIGTDDDDDDDNEANTEVVEESDTHLIELFEQLPVAPPIKAQPTAAKPAAPAKPQGSDRFSNVSSIYHWTFNNGRTAGTAAWKIAIPDGFVVSSGRSERAFIAVPAAYKGNEDSASVSILPGVENESGIEYASWRYHPNARKAVAEIFAYKYKQLASSVSMLGSAPAVADVYSEAWGECFAQFLVMDTDNGSFSYQGTVYHYNKAQMIRVQTQRMTKLQKEALTDSIQRWIKTFKPSTPNGMLQGKPLIRQSNVLDGLKSGNTGPFEEAIDEAYADIICTIRLRLTFIQELVNEGDMDMKEAEPIVRRGLREELEAARDYMLWIDEVVQAAKSKGVSATTLRTMSEKLEDLNEFITSINLDEKPVTEKEPDDVIRLRAEWARLG